ncbi:hypothetical protein [Alteribacillus bidgolensis]|nr:hypothetical protein [Alteribacillus bidgolensis]
MSEVIIGVSGIIKNVNVTTSKKFLRKTLLAMIEDDMLLSGSD